MHGSKPNEHAAQEAQANNPGCCTTFERATGGFDPEFERALASEIRKAIGRASVVTDRKATVLRTGEIVSALAACISQTLALRQDMRQPRKLREMVDMLTKRIKRDATQIIAEDQASERQWGRA
jgi:hypothetical protein